MLCRAQWGDPHSAPAGDRDREPEPVRGGRGEGACPGAGASGSEFSTLAATVKPVFKDLFLCFSQAFETSARRLPQTSVSCALALLLQPWPAPGTVGALRGLSAVHLAGVTSPFWPLIPYL